MQVAAGAGVIQLFDSWAGLHDARTYREFGVPYLSRIMTALGGNRRRAHPVCVERRASRRRARGDPRRRRSVWIGGPICAAVRIASRDARCKGISTRRCSSPKPATIDAEARRVLALGTRRRARVQSRARDLAGDAGRCGRAARRDRARVRARMTERRSHTAARPRSCVPALQDRFCERVERGRTRAPQPHCRRARAARSPSTRGNASRREARSGGPARRG